MTGRQVAALLAASLIGIGMTSGAYGQSRYENQPPGRPGDGGFSVPSYFVPSVPFFAPRYSTPSYVPPAADFVSADAENNGTALLRVHLPADAKLFFGKTAATGQSGSMRLFRSPSLDPGSNYQYDLRAQWTENGHAVERTRTVPIHAGDVVNVDFTHGG